MKTPPRKLPSIVRSNNLNQWWDSISTHTSKKTSESTPSVWFTSQEIHPCTPCEIILHNDGVMFTPYGRNVLPPSQVNKNSAQLLSDLHLVSWAIPFLHPISNSNSKQGMGRAIERLGWSLVFCSSHPFNTSFQSSLPRSIESSVVYDNMWYLPPGYRGQSHFIMHWFSIIQYVRSTMYQVRNQN